MRWLLLVLLANCAAPQVVQLLPDSEPMCGFVVPWRHCCVKESGAQLIVHCVDFEKIDNTTPPVEAPKES